METVAFYSYKGGVGRSLLLANAARFLARTGKHVLALDLDFEAPGLHYKFGGVEVSTSGGVVPYLIATVDGSISPPSFADHMINVLAPPHVSGWMRLMPAGPAPHREYWIALKKLGDKLRLGDPSGRGIMAMLDLQARIEEELKPDYLLIDSRTGITELGGLAATVLSDTVVCLFAKNQESIDGTLAVVEALKIAPRLTGQKPIRIVSVLSRYVKTDQEDEQFWRGVKRLRELTEGTSDKDPEIPFILPHDDKLGTGEVVFNQDRYNSRDYPLFAAQLILFRHMFPPQSKPIDANSHKKRKK